MARSFLTFMIWRRQWPLKVHLIVIKSSQCPLARSPYHLQCRIPIIPEWWVLTSRRKDNCPANERDKFHWGQKKQWALGSDLDSPGCLPWNYAEGHWDSAQNLSLGWTLLWTNFQLGYFNLNHKCFHRSPIGYLVFSSLDKFSCVYRIHLHHPTFFLGPIFAICQNIFWKKHFYWIFFFFSK